MGRSKSQGFDRSFDGGLVQFTKRGHWVKKGLTGGYKRPIATNLGFFRGDFTEKIFLAPNSCFQVLGVVTACQTPEKGSRGEIGAYGGL